MTSPSVHMTPRQWLEVAAILHALLPPDRHVFAFGSRATGIRVKRYSDLDLAVEGRLMPKQRASLVDAFDESLLPFKVDVIELGLVDADFRARINPDLLLLPVSATDRLGSAPGPPIGTE